MRAGRCMIESPQASDNGGIVTGGIVEGRTIDRIVLDPRIMVGKPVVRGTRIPVYTVLQQLSSDLDLDELFRSFPRLTREDVQACLEYAAGVVEGEDIYPVFLEGPGKSSAE